MLTEHQIQAAAISQYRARGTSNSVLFAIPNGSLRDAITGALLRAEGVEPGAPDLFGAALGRPCMIEVKADKGRLSPAQIAMHRRIIAAGGGSIDVIVTYGLDELVSVLERRGFLRPNAAYIAAA